MATNDSDKLNRIEELKGKLFTKNYQTKLEHRETFSHTNRESVPDAWDNDKKSPIDPKQYQNMFFMKTYLFKNFFIVSLVFLVLTLCYAAYVFFAGGNTVSNDNIDISIIGNNFAAGGEDLPLIVGIANRNSSPLELADIILEYPRGSTKAPNSGSTDSSAGTETFRVSLGTIPAGAVRNENLKVTLFGQQGEVRPLKISIEYRVEGSNAIFVKDKYYDVTISSTPLNLAVDAPLTVSSNQDITLNIKATLNTDKPVSKILLKLDYPLGFQFESAVPAPAISNNVWALGDMSPGAERSISITGKMLDVVDGEQKIFHISSGSQSSTDKSMIGVVFNSLSQTVTVARPFIEGKIFVNGVSSREYALDTKTGVHAEVRWQNNLDTKVTDLVIQATITGNAVDRKTIIAEQGFYDSAKGTITWDKSTIADFSEVNPGDSGVLNFSLSPLSLFSATSGLLTSPLININVSISGKQSVSSYVTEDIHNSDSGIIRIISDVGFTDSGLYYSGPFHNTGPIPPKVGKETLYTVTWSISNTANNLSQAVIKSSIPEWIRYVGTTDPADEDLGYNASTREIVWNAGSVPKGAGIATANKTVSFQLGFTPSLSQLATTPIILNDAILTGHDDFANVDVKATKPALRTQLNSDQMFPGGGGTVTE